MFGRLYRNVLFVLSVSLTRLCCAFGCLFFYASHLFGRLEKAALCSDLGFVSVGNVGLLYGFVDLSRQRGGPGAGGIDSYYVFEHSL